MIYFNGLGLCLAQNFCFKVRCSMDTNQDRGIFYVLDAEMEQRAQDLHEGAFIFDAAISMLGFDKEEKTEIQAFHDGGVTGGNMSLSTSETDFSLAI